MRCHFGKSGRYLHIAEFEGRTTEAQQEEGSIHVTLLVHTYRLCSKKPTRSPPTHMHSFQVDLGVIDEVQVHALLVVALGSEHRGFPLLGCCTLRCDQTARCG